MAVLIIDDDYAIRDALRLILEDEGYRVVAVSDGRDALEHLRNADYIPCLILLDLMMPGLSGWEFRQIQKQDPQLASIPVAIVSADHDVGTKASSLGAEGYLAKPIDFGALMSLVGRYCAAG